MERGEGIYIKARVPARIKEKLDQIGLGERLNFASVSRRYPGQVEEAIGQFRQKIEAIGSKREAK